MRHSLALPAWLCFAGLALGSVPAAWTQTPTATVTGVLNETSATLPGQGSIELRGGMSLPAGTLVKTGPRSAIDLDFGAVAGVIRLTENSQLQLETLKNTGAGNPAALQLGLRLLQGTLLGDSRPVPPSASFEVKVSNGIVGIDQGRYRINAQGFIVLLEGTLVFSHIAQPGSDPEPHVLTAPHAVYFSPIEKIRPAPDPLVKEVINQTRSKLPRR